MDFINYMENILFGSTATKFFLSDLLCPSEWKLHYLSISTRDIGCSANGNADLQKWVLPLSESTLDPEMGERAQLGWPQEEFAPGNPCWVLLQDRMFQHTAALPSLPRKWSLSPVVLAISAWHSKVIPHNVLTFSAET